MRDKKIELDLSKEKCHVCGNTMARNIRAEKEWCVNPGCTIRNTKLSIPYKEVKDEY